MGISLLGELLLKKGLITKEQLDEALRDSAGNEDCWGRF